MGRILLMPFGSSGDVNPFIGLGVECARRNLPFLIGACLEQVSEGVERVRDPYVDKRTTTRALHLIEERVRGAGS